MLHKQHKILAYPDIIRAVQKLVLSSDCSLMKWIAVKMDTSHPYFDKIYINTLLVKHLNHNAIWIFPEWISSFVLILHRWFMLCSYVQNATRRMGDNRVHFKNVGPFLFVREVLTNKSLLSMLQLIVCEINAPKHAVIAFLKMAEQSPGIFLKYNILINFRYTCMLVT